MRSKTLPSPPTAEFRTVSLSWPAWLETALPLVVLRRTLKALFIFLKDLLLRVDRSKCRAATVGKNKSMQFSCSGLEPCHFCNCRHTKDIPATARLPALHLCTWLQLTLQGCTHLNLDMIILSLSHTLELPPPLASFTSHAYKSPVSMVAWERIILSWGRISSAILKLYKFDQITLWNLLLKTLIGKKLAPLPWNPAMLPKLPTVSCQEFKDYQVGDTNYITSSNLGKVIN